MFAKVKISGVLETITGLHIGGFFCDWCSRFSCHPGCKDEYADDSG